jgi:hypothetical protein
MNIIINAKTPEYLFATIDQYITTYGKKRIDKHFNIAGDEFFQLYQQMDVGGPYADIDEMYAAYSNEPGCKKAIWVSKKSIRIVF